MANLLLTDKQVAAIKPQAKKMTYEDGNGLHFVVPPSGQGQRHWLVRFRRPGRRIESLLLGLYPEMSLAEARKRTDTLLANFARLDEPKPQPSTVPVVLVIAPVEKSVATQPDYLASVLEAAAKGLRLGVRNKKALNRLVPAPKG